MAVAAESPSLRPPLRLAWVSVALASTLAAGTAHAAPDAATTAQLKALADRLQQLEQRNQVLEQEVKALRGTVSTTAPAPMPTATPTAGSGWGAERLDRLERRVSDLARAPEALDDEAGDDGPSIEGGVLAMGQQVGARGSDSGREQGRLNWRGDIEVSLPMGNVHALGDARLSGFGHLRFGQGTGVGLRPTHTATVNSIAFEAGAGSDETYAIVAQAFGQLEWTLDAGRFNDLASNRVELTLGKMDVFGFFDQNAVAGDEGAQFLNNVFVHNPLLDSGGDIAADAYGLAPGVRLAYIDEGEERGWGFGASLGVFGAGAGANFSGAPTRPLVIGQVEFSPRQINGEARGNYRLYAWTNGQTTSLTGDAMQRHSGYGLSVDQRLGRDWNVFGRWGHRTSGEGAFDKALTLGFEHGGRAWGRGNDAAGLAAGWVRTSGEWARATALDTSLVGFAASGNEQVVEAYYRFKLGDHLELTPDLQWIRRAGGDGSAPSFTVVGLRAAVSF
ncbi:MAG: carbohydrate porin [Vitreoscilla sp.]|nr:carbohydrate porin [Vitreoscilla sp.]